VRKAYERQKELAETLNRHTASVEGVNNIVQAIMEEDALHTEWMASELATVQAIATRLVKCLEGNFPTGKGQARQIAHHLLRGTQQEETLRGIMGELERAKSSLTLHIQLASLGLTKMVRDLALAGNKGDTGDGQSKLGMIAEPGSQSWSFDSTATLVDGGAAADNVAIGNTARDSAVQLLGPVGVNLWENTRTRAEQNHASGQAVQIASSTDLETLKYLLSLRKGQQNIEPRTE
jgi:hypothetical protein